MKLSALLPVVALASPALAKGGDSSDQLPESTPASSVLATITDLPKSVSGKQYTALASSLYSIDKKFYNDKSYTTFASHMWSAAAKASDSEKVVPSLALSTWTWDAITSAAWFDKNMPKDDKNYVSKYLDDRGTEYQKVVGGGGSGKGGDDKKGSAAPSAAVVWSAAVLAGVAGFVAAM